ncbi:hypothetical protein B0H19DRAFT_1085835 [Mycena capillaripes]|nr:hypothetical protein B0H19DRAFT_1085835 [Mycena capillaripes]
MQKMPAELRAKLPNSTNASESSHWLLYRGVGFKFDLFEGIRRLYRFQRETEMLYAAITAGHVDARFQGIKAQPKSRITWHENDGRAPDTRERLAAIEKIEDSMQRQSTLCAGAVSLNAALSSTTVLGTTHGSFLAYIQDYSISGTTLTAPVSHSMSHAKLWTSSFTLMLALPGSIF